MARKKIKKIWLMGKLRDLWLDYPDDFEWLRSRPFHPSKPSVNVYSYPFWVYFWVRF